MSAQAYAARQHKVVPWFKQLWLWLVLTPPLISIIAGSYMASLAYKAQDAMVVDDYYNEGKAINQDLRRDKAAAKLKLSALMAYDPVQGKITGRLLSPETAQSGLITIKLIHPTQPAKDLTIATQLGENGDFKFSLPMLDRALWQIMLEDQARQWRLSGSWNWPGQQPIDLTPL